MCTLALATEQLQHIDLLPALETLRCWADKQLPVPDGLRWEIDRLITKVGAETERKAEGDLSADDWSAFERKIAWRIAYLLYRLDPKAEIEKGVDWAGGVGAVWKSRLDQALVAATKGQLPFPDPERLNEKDRPRGHAGAIIDDKGAGPTAGSDRPISPRIPHSDRPDFSREEPDRMTEGEEASSPPSPPPAPAPVPEAPRAENGGGGPAAPGSSAFSEGRILYAIPDKMALQQPTNCRVRIAHGSLADELLSANLTETERAAVRKETIQITPVMVVELEEATGSENFRIHAQSSLEQLVLPGDYTEWVFAVTPLKPGHFALLLRVTAKVNVPGFGERQKDISVLNRAIEVTATGEVKVDTTFSMQPVPDPVWNIEDEAAVIQSIQLNRLDKAIERLANFLFDKDRDLHNQLILLQGRWSETYDFFIKQLITLNEWQVASQKTRLGLLGLLRDVSEIYAPAGKSKEHDWAPTIDKLQDLPA
ncbi:MAG: hypothetical protein KDC54_23595, partial [Lewinella sp.]|nr:hypothetical protein [Lewinella sp.]